MKRKNIQMVFFSTSKLIFFQLISYTVNGAKSTKRFDASLKPQNYKDKKTKQWFHSSRRFCSTFSWVFYVRKAIVKELVNHDVQWLINANLMTLHTMSILSLSKQAIGFVLVPRHSVSIKNVYNVGSYSLYRTRSYKSFSGSIEATLKFQPVGEMVTWPIWLAIFST